MIRRAALFAFALGGVQPAHAQNQAIPGLIAKRETAGLSYEDKLAAYDAEQAVLAKNEIVLGYNWKGPNGAYGTIIVGSFMPTVSGYGQCRRFIHIIHSKGDGGLNPTFQGTICRDGSNHWIAQ